MREGKRMKVTVYYATAKKEEIAKIQEKYQLPSGYSVNGEVVCNLTDKVVKEMQSEVEKGLIQLRFKEYDKRRSK
jgi:hypothetical protein